ncbi:PREDICTED: uncharacterized protein LOC106122504 [Papilio xuthus]|uniref:Uncharacterized protein LOC106122504 n=1 Tax=Papilio xuthus TaxID=66420 RepID=A0AAJ6ZJR6_PAPXU|nr:PREDICTED: uncharacterized protein LOC106122504 [Papilio xuthus]
MLNLIFAFLCGCLVGFCHGLPASVSEAHSAATQELHLYLKNSTNGLDPHFSPIVSQLRAANDQVEVGRDSILPFLTFLFDTLGLVDNEIDDCIDDMMIEFIPDEPTDPGYPTAPPVVTETLETAAPPVVPAPVVPDVPIAPADAVKTDPPK